MGMSGLVVMPAFSVPVPPVAVDFDSGSLNPMLLLSGTEGRITVVGDTANVETELIGDQNNAAGGTGGNRMRGNYYQCDETVALYKQSMHLDRSQQTAVTFVVYESSTSDGTYSLIASNVVSASTGTGLVQSGEINTLLRAGKYYMIGAAWDQSSTYRYYGTPHPVATSFGQTLSGYGSNVYPAPQTTSGSVTTYLYPQQLVISDNLVARLDDRVDGSLYSINSLNLLADFGGYSDVFLSFRYRDEGDEQDSEDGVFLSTDGGSSFFRIDDLSDSTQTWKTKTLDIAAFAASQGLTLSSASVIRFQQKDNYGWPTDGREFDDIKLYSLPDLEAVSVKSGGSTSVSMLWKGFVSEKQIPLEFAVESRGGNADFAASSLRFSYRLRDSGGTTQEYDYDTLAWNIGAMEIKTDTLTSVLTIPASEHLPDLNYTVRAFADALTTMTEALENNNDATISVTVNHYSGWLWFDDVKADITISSWSTRVTDSPVEHTISGTGVLDGETFSFTDLKVDKNLASLDYSLDSTETTVINVPYPDPQEVSQVTYWLSGGVYLSKNGAYSAIRVLFPAGLGVGTTSREVLIPTYSFGSCKLTQGLYPAETLTANEPFHVVEETKPIGYDASAMAWEPETGIFTFTGIAAWSVRNDQYLLLESRAGLLVDPAMAEKKSNAGYYRNVAALLASPVVRTGSNGEAKLSAEIGIDPTDIVAHFPYGVRQEWVGSSTLEIFDDLIHPSNSGMETPKNGMLFHYSRDCHGNLGCAGETGMATVQFSPNVSTTSMSMDGGLRTPVSIGSGGNLQWGARWNGEFSQQTDAFAEGNLYIAGHFIRGDHSGFDATSQRGPAEILLSGVAINALEEMERPSNANYADGLADYAGLNLRVGTDGALDANSIVGGIPSGAWPLTGRSKYYARYSGVSGIHEAVWGSPDSMKIYEYLFGFSNYGLSYLSGKPEDSRINGDVYVASPCNITMDFENLMLDCLGELGEAELANADMKTLEYWDADIQPLTLFFAPTASSVCSNAARRLCMGLTTQCANVDQTLSGILGFLPDGELGTPADEIEGVPSRLAVPNQIELAGPGNETYYFTPISMPYYNDFSQSGDTMSSPGWINFGGNLDVSFFRDLRVHFHTSASTNSAVAKIYMMGGWEQDGEILFNLDPDEFDTGNRGYPPELTSYSAYRNPSTDDYRVRAKRKWLGVIDFDYPLAWSSAAKAFKSPKELEDPLLVVQVQHQTDYLSADNTEISFGLQYDGVPQINLANMAFNAVDEATGMMSAFTNAVGDGIHDAIDDGMSAFADTLSDLPEKLFDPVFDEVLDPMVDEFYTDLYVAYINQPAATDFGLVVTQYLYGVAGPTYDNVGTIISNMANAASASANLIDRVSTNLDQAVQLINAFADVVSMTNGVALPEGSGIDGLLSINGGDYQMLADLGIGILETLSETLYDSIKGTIEEEMTEVLSSVAPSLETITEVLLELRDVIEEVQGHLASAGPVATELRDVLRSPLVSDTLDTIAAEIMRQMEALSEGDSSFDEYTPEEVKAMLRRYITDAFYSSVPCANVQQVLRSQLYELESMVQESIDSVFAQLNKAMKDLVSEYLAGIDEEINGVLGDLSDVMGAGQIDGYAHIRHDTLNELRLDGKFQWKVPDEMEFNAFLIIKDLNSTMPGGCGVDADSLPEVTLGTTDFGLSMMGSDIRADISTKFAFAESNSTLRLIGMGGSFEMTEGEIGFESFAINEFYAGVAFGALENYLSANIHCTFTSYEVEGGIFLGKACRLDPFSWDPEVQAVLGDPPFLGIYVYGEGWMPIVDYGCLFCVKAGVGAGIFYFVDGPVGGKIFLGASGEALCAVNVSGAVTLVGVKDGENLRMNGKGRISGRAGSCPFCVKFGKTVTITYDNGDWDADY